jgi:very-short-patch-repair endonuclease
VPLAHAIVQVGLYPPDDPSDRSPMDSVIAADFALRHGLVAQAQLESAVKAHASHPGIAAVRKLMAHADGRHESPGETRLAHSLRLLGYRFTPQVPLPGGHGYRGDFVLDDDPVVVEFDGLAKYSLGGATATGDSHDAVRQNLAAEKRREEDVRRAGQHEFARFIWQEADNLSLVRDRVDAAIARARLRRTA